MKTNRTMLKSLLVAGMMVLGLAGARAQNGGQEDKTLSPYFVVLSENPDLDGLPLKETSASTVIVGSIADVTVRQVYVNTGKNPLEAVYTFPMSTRAAVYAMQMRIGDRVVRAQIEEKQKARADYEKAKQEGKRASLLEQSRPNVFTMNVGNIMPGDTLQVELRYTELLVPEKGVYTFVYPTVVGPRYVSESGERRVESGERATQGGGIPYTHAGQEPTYKFDFDLTIQAGMPIQDVSCRTHKMKVRPVSLRCTSMALDPAEKAGGNRDVIVSYSLRGSAVESGVMLYEGVDENFFLAMVQPPKRVAKEQIPPREYIFILDVSGSMWGTPMDITKQLMRNLIANLNPQDKFNLVLFSGRAAQYSPTSVDATPANLEKADAFIQSGSAYGGTEVLNALRTAYAIPRPDEDIARTFVMATDGYVTCEADCFELVRQNAGNTNFFIFGIGSSVNRYMIEGMAFSGGGEPMIVTDMNEAAAKAERFREYINTPVVTRLKLSTGGGFDTYDVEPVAIPDVMAERPVMVFGKYVGKAKGTLTLSGKVGRKAWKQTFDLSRQKADTANSALRYLWARERIKYLNYQQGKGWNKNTAIGHQILDLGLRYNLMTEYTSFVAIDEVVVNKDGKQTTVNQPVPMPEGVSDNAIGSASGVGGMVQMRSSVKRGFVNTSSNNLSIAALGSAVVEEEDEAETQIFSVVETDPEFPGGMDSLYAFLARNIVYPKLAKENKIQGKVYITFTVEVDGSISNIKVLRDIGGGCGQEAVRVVKMMPKWIPGKQRGKAVRVQYNLPINFVLPTE